MSNNSQALAHRDMGEITEFELPKFAIEQDRWANFRNKNVNAVSKIWTDEPNRVMIFSDPRLECGSLALIRKDYLEKLIKIIRDVDRDQAAIEHSVDAIVGAIGIAEKIAQKDDPKDLPILRQAVSNLATLKVFLTSRIFVKKSPRKVAPSPLSEEEKAKTSVD